MSDGASGAADGVVVVDKPRGPTSHDVVARVRRWVRPSRAGHTGTLDPMATGVLPVCVGAATRLSRFLTKGPKAYSGRIVLGIATDTFDAEGKILESRAVEGVDLERVRGAAAALTGDLRQVPPPWSAKRIGGRRAYDLAREGREEKLPPCDVRVERFDVLEMEGGAVRFEVECSSGTYVRSLASDLGISLGCGAHLAELRRTRSGPFTLDQARPLVALEEAARLGRLGESLVPLDALDLGMEAATLTPSGVRSALAGRRLSPEDLAAPVAPGHGPFRLTDLSGRLLGIAEPAPGYPGSLQPRLVLARSAPDREKALYRGQPQG